MEGSTDGDWGGGWENAGMHGRAGEDEGMDGEEWIGGLMAEWKNKWTCERRRTEEWVEEERVDGETDE